MSNSRNYLCYSQRVKIFRGLTAHEVMEILQQGQNLRFRAGEPIFHQGQLGSTIFIIQSGMVNIENRGGIIATLHPGEAFGEMSVLNHRPHCASAAAATDVKLITVDESQIDALLDRHVASRFLLNVINVLSVHLEESNSLLAQQTRRGQRDTKSCAGAGLG